MNISEWQEKALHGRFPKMVSVNSSTETWLWLQKGKLKWMTESLLVAAHVQALRIKWIKAKIDKNQVKFQCKS